MGKAWADGQRLIRVANTTVGKPESRARYTRRGRPAENAVRVSRERKERRRKADYADFEKYGIVFLLTVYSKNETENITAEDKAFFRGMLKRIETELDGGVQQ